MSAQGTKMALDLGKTENCKTISYHFSMGIGRLRQMQVKTVTPDQAFGDKPVLGDNVQNEMIVTTAKASELRHQKRLIDSPELDEIRSQDSKLKRFVELQSAAAGNESTRFVLASEVERIWRVMEA